MASAEYYLGSQGAQQYQNQHPPAAYPPQQPQYHQPQSPAQPWSRQQYKNTPYTSTLPPSYSSYAPQPEKQQLQAYPPPPSAQQQQQQQQQQYPTKGYQGAAPPYFPPPPQQSNGYLGAPLQHIRSHSQPATRVRFADQESTALGSETESDSDSCPRRHYHHGSHRRTRDHGRSRDLDRESDYSDRDYDRSRGSRTKTHQKKHESRDTFLGAGAGGIIGDAIFPGLGTAAGLLIGGLGGRKYAKDKRSHSEEGRTHRHRDAYREGREEGREDKESRKHRHRDAYREGKEDSRRDRARDSGYGYGERDVERGYEQGRDNEYGRHVGHDSH
ncbi:hypothetical protein EJ07DRAFT_151982 [Lizonia empirigonia]|nr:hypothetical protein EJ07DRAFT_151982 [Lizonia empirigonia]